MSDVRCKKTDSLHRQCAYMAGHKGRHAFASLNPRRDLRQALVKVKVLSARVAELEANAKADDDTIEELRRDIATAWSRVAEKDIELREWSDRVAELEQRALNAEARFVELDAERAALLDYLRGEWVDCTHGFAAPGCPICEGRWSDEVGWVVHEHRFNLWTALNTDFDTIGALRRRVAELEAQHVTDTAACISVNHERSQVRRERDEALAEVERLRAGVDLPPGHRVAVVTIAAADDDPTFTVGGMTVRACPCGALVAGGPTRCIACASRLDRGPIASSERTRRAVVHLIESLGREIGDDSVAADFLRAIAVLLEVDRG